MQTWPKKPAIVTRSTMSTKLSTGSGAMLWRAGAGGTDWPKDPATATISTMSETLSLLMSAGQALWAAFAAQGAAGSVPMIVS